MSDLYDELRAINNLLALVTGAERATIDHIQSAINFTLEGADTEGPTEDGLLRAAGQIVKLHQHSEHGSDTAFAHCDLRSDAYDPLFLREKVLSTLRSMAGYPSAVILVTGLRRMICPPGNKWTLKRQDDYDKAVQYIDEVAAQHSAPSTRLHLLYL